MRVKDLILYQVATDKNYKVGDKLSFGKEKNGQYHKCESLSFNQNGKPLHELGFKHYKKGILKNKDLILNMSRALSDYDFILREFALEEVRKESFPTLPSRFTCLYLSENETTCLNNFTERTITSPNLHHQAIKVKVSGEAHFVRDFGISRLGLSYSEYKKLANQYWSQNQESTTEAKEILFIGDVEVLEILQETK